MNTLQQQIKMDAAYLQLLFKKGKYSREIEERYQYNLELLFQRDLDFINTNPQLN
jgi:DNA phosphorothioation-dependent restriction protein DptG